MPVDPETGKRLPGRPSKAERQSDVAERELSATEKLEALRALRLRSNGPIVPRPAAITLDSFRKWMADVAAIGGSGDVEVVWHAVNDHRLKAKLDAEYRRLQAIADQRYGPLVQAAKAERALERQREMDAANKANLQRRAARLEADAADIKRRLQN